MARRIVSNPEVLFGKPTFEGTRISVEVVLRSLAAGEPIEQVLESYPKLTREDVLEALTFAADSLRADAVYSTSA